MLISLNWLKNFVAIPATLDPKELALQFTTTTAEVEGVEARVANFEGLVAARIESMQAQPGDAKLKTVVVDVGGRKLTSLTTAPDVAAGELFVYAPPRARVGDQTLGTKDAAGRESHGMIVAWGALGFEKIGAHAIRLPARSEQSPGADGFSSGDRVDAALFSDWIIEIDNKSITHRPDCWGHYGIAREIAAMLRLPLVPYDVTPASELTNKLPAIPIEIDDPERCPRYSALAVEGLRAQPSPLWMQARLALCGMRPIDLIVDLTNYVMLELGQPMHAFDGAKIANIQVATAKAGEKFRTLDGIERTLPPETLMIQCNRKHVGIAGVMGGAETEVSPATTTVLLESANFDAATIRRAATSMGHRTEASARFEKSLDPANTVLGLGRFHRLASRELPTLKLAGTLSDCYPRPKQPAPIRLDCEFAARVIGNVEGDMKVTPERMVDIFSRLEFKYEKGGGAVLEVTPPSFRATKDISIEADLIEEIARFVGYNNVVPALPRVTARHFEPSRPLALEERTLNYFCLGADFVEVHNYIWYDDDWLARLGFAPGDCITLRNPAANNCSRLRKSLAPGLIAMAEQNRHHFDRIQLVELGSVFEPGQRQLEEAQHRRLGLLLGQQGKGSDQRVWDRLKLALAGWATHTFETPVTFESASATAPWEHADRTAAVLLGGSQIGRATLLPPDLLTRLDERLRSWAFALVEVDLRPAALLLDHFEKLPRVPRFPQPDLDFSVLIDASRRFGDAAKELSRFRHPLLKRLTFVDSYEGGSIPEGRRSLLFRARIGSEERTLTDDEIQTFNLQFREFLIVNGMELRS